MSDTPRTYEVLFRRSYVATPAAAALENLCCQLERELAAKQAEIDRLKLEYCPNEMTMQQRMEWAKHQTPAVAAPEKYYTGPERRVMQRRVRRLPLWYIDRLIELGLQRRTATKDRRAKP